MRTQEKMKGGLLKPNPKAKDVPGELSVVDDSDEYLTDEQVMSWLHVKKQWLADHRTRVEPIIPHIAMGKQILYPKRALQIWLRSLVETRPSWARMTASSVQANPQEAAA